MEIYPMLTGSQLRQYLHISTRKLKYLMDHDYIPHEDTGQATYRYRVRWEDAVEFKRRMEEEPGFLGELAGQFSSHHPPKPRPKPEPVFQPTPENCQRFRQWLAQRWANEQDALPIQRAAQLLGRNPPDPPPLDKGGPPPGSAGGTEPAVQQGGAPRFFGHAGEGAGVPGAGGGVFGRDAISTVRNRGRRPTAEGGQLLAFSFCCFLVLFCKV